MKIDKDALILAQVLGGGGGITPTGNQDISTLNEYDVTDKATARVSADERAKITPEHITAGTTILGVAGSAVVPSGNQDIETLSEYDVTAKATARVSATERAKIIPENIKQGETILGVEGSYSGGGGGVPSNDVNFIDYDGTIVYAYSAADFANLSAMPDNPTHEGLTAQGWNWSLADAKSCVANNGFLDIGQMYITDNGKTRLYITIASINLRTVGLYVGYSGSAGSTIDWGDSSTPDAIPSSSSTYTTHTYASVGNYIISLSPTFGATIMLGTSSYSVIGKNDYVSTANRAMLRKVELGSDVRFGDTAFADLCALETMTVSLSIDFSTFSSVSFVSCYSLKSLSLPNGVTNLPVSKFSNCYSLSSISIPKTCTTINNSAFLGCGSLVRLSFPPGTQKGGNGINSCCDKCYSLKYVSIPDSIEVSGSYMYRYCTSLHEITIPASMKYMGAFLFSYCSSLSKVTISEGVLQIGGMSDCPSLVDVKLPSTVTSVKASAFTNDYCFSLLDCTSCTAVPTLEHSNAFNSTSSGLQILVPSALYNDWIAASNWSTYASKIVAV